MRHHNTKGFRQTQRDKPQLAMRRLARRLHVPFGEAAVAVVERRAEIASRK